jgi:hypothetical protein
MLVGILIVLSWHHQSLFFFFEQMHRNVSLMVNKVSVNLSSHLHIVLRLKINGTMPHSSVHLHGVMPVSTGTILPSL